MLVLITEYDGARIFYKYTIRHIRIMIHSALCSSRAAHAN